MLECLIESDILVKNTVKGRIKQISYELLKHIFDLVDDIYFYHKKMCRDKELINSNQASRNFYKNWHLSLTQDNYFVCTNCYTGTQYVHSVKYFEFITRKKTENERKCSLRGSY